MLGFSCILVILSKYYFIYYNNALNGYNKTHYNHVTMTAMASQITSVSSVCSTVGSGVDQNKHQSSSSLAFVRGIHRWPVNSPRKRPVTRKMFPFDDVIMYTRKTGAGILYLPAHHTTRVGANALLGGWTRVCRTISCGTNSHKQ